jgi:hypothetical protein
MLEKDYEYKINNIIYNVSDPKKVLINLIKYCNKYKLIQPEIYISTNKIKKYMILNPYNNFKPVHFGSIDYEDFTKHNDKQRKIKYLNRALNIKGNWRGYPFSPNNLSINLLWS